MINVTKAAFDAAEEILDVGGEPDFTAKYKDGYEAGFLAGAAWQREQDAAICEHYTDHEGKNQAHWAAKLIREQALRRQCQGEAMSCQCDYLRQVAQDRGEWTDRLKAENAKLRKVLDDIAHGCSHTLANEERFLHTYGKSYPDLLRDIYKRCREVLAACGDNAKEKL